MQGTHRSIRSTVAAAACALIASMSVGISHAKELGGPDKDGVEYTEKLRRVTEDKATVAAEIVSRWENDARASGRWDVNYAQDLFGSLMKLQPSNMVAASQATSYQGLMSVLMTGRETKAVTAKSLGEFGVDTVYTPITPCRIVDTRSATAGFLAVNVIRTFDVDGSNFTAQGGVNTSCGIPLGVASAVVMSIAVTGPDAPGFFRAWGLGAEPGTSFLNYVAGQTIAVTTIVPVVPGAGNDFSLVSRGGNAHAVIDVMGYFAAPEATALDCTSPASAVTSIPYNVYTSVDAICPAGTSVTGGGTFPIEGTLGRASIWTDGSPTAPNGWRTWVDNQTGAARSVQTYARCCRVPGR
jgi:hypothetical protein